MNKFLLLALFVCALLFIPSTQFQSYTASAQSPVMFDLDKDGVPFSEDCNDRDPTISEEDGLDEDQDGFTQCQGDCQDNDPTIHRCEMRTKKLEPSDPMYVVPPENCQPGLLVTEIGYGCYGFCGPVYERQYVILTNC